MRLDKYLCEAGLGTRSQVKKLLKSGVVTVNGQTVLRPEERLEETDRVAVSGRELSVARLEYWMLNKPAGCVSATEDARFQTVTELLPAEARRDLFPVGRLDRDTEGLLLLTNDGKLAHFLLSPKRHVDKVYYARVRGRVTKEHVKLFAEGLDIGDEKKTLPAVLEILQEEETARVLRERREEKGTGSAGEPEETGESRVRITIREGRFHQIKRMFEAVGCEVAYLRRLSMGSLTLDEGLTPGGCRRLTEREVEALKEETGC